VLGLGASPARARGCEPAHLVNEVAPLSFAHWHGDRGLRSCERRRASVALTAASTHQGCDWSLALGRAWLLSEVFRGGTRASCVPFRVPDVMKARRCARPLELTLTRGTAGGVGAQAPSAHSTASMTQRFTAPRRSAGARIRTAPAAVAVPPTPPAGARAIPCPERRYRGR
jgi:hypothetical protein